MKLEISYFQSITPSVFRETTTEVCHGVDKLVCDVKQQLDDNGKLNKKSKYREQG